jgi:cbb3-type cytochrome oxidase subunit 3
MSLPRQWTRLAMLLFSVTCGISAFVHSRSIEQPPPTAVDPTSIATIDELYTQLEDLRECNRTVDSPLIRQMLNFSVVELERNQPLIFWLINLIAKHSYLVEKSMPLNASMTTQPAALPVDKSPALALHLKCESDGTSAWVPFATYPTAVPNAFLQLELPQLQLNACPLSQCDSSKCAWTMHGSIRVFARTCCSDDTKVCRSQMTTLRNMCYVISVLFALCSIAIIPMVFRERRRQQQEARGWALMELFFTGATLLYLIVYSAITGVC